MSLQFELDDKIDGIIEKQIRNEINVSQSVISRQNSAISRNLQTEAKVNYCKAYKENQSYLYNQSVLDKSLKKLSALDSRRESLKMIQTQSIENRKNVREQKFNQTKQNQFNITEKKKEKISRILRLSQIRDTNKQKALQNKSLQNQLKREGSAIKT